VHVAKPLDLPALAATAALVRGEHDFRAFTPTESHHVRFRRVIYESRWDWYDGGLLVYRVAANSFLYGMVRALVGTMLEVGRRRYALGDFERLLGGAERSEAGPAAPARGLTLVGVDYGDLDLWGGE
jgi:tRNA pseudouridine38-40 synthase